MPPFPVLSGPEVVNVFEKLGWRSARQSGSHIIMTKPGEIASLSIPKHREVARGTLRSLIRAANLTVDEFIEAANS
jgi:predicted RNA binding protein YcfA (HicA-like mRNA interferase family)